MSKQTKRCAPWCGYGCTEQEYQQAAGDGTKLAQQLGADWTVHVWENMGWFYEVISPCGRLKIRQRKFGARNTRYSASLSEPGVIGGRWYAPGPSPRAAIKAVVEKATAELDAIAQLVEGL